MDGRATKMKTTDDDASAKAPAKDEEDTAGIDDVREKEKAAVTIHFDPDFDASLVERLIAAFQLDGCFFCDKQGASSKCSRCKVAVYCDKECQRQAWRKGHKHACQCFCFEIKEQETKLFAIRSAGWITEEQFMMLANRRRELLLSTLSELPNKPHIGFCSSAIEILGSIRLVGSLSFYDGHTCEIREIRDVFVHPIEEVTPVAKFRLYNGSGTISQTARAKAIEEWLEFAKLLKLHDLPINITFGRGMMDFVRDEEFRRLLGEQVGQKHVSFMSSMDHSLINEMTAGMKAIGI